MRKTIRKLLLSAIGYIGFFCGYFYILFINLVCSYLPYIVTTRWNVIKILLLSFVLAAGLPGVICYQHHKIYKLEKEIEEIKKH